MKEIYAPQSDLIQNKYGASLIEGIIKKAVEDNNFK
jgi:hypothetical protein